MPAKKSDRCWPGYEPVKGKAQHEQGSCRPKAESKLSSGEKTFRKARRKQLDKWEEEHPHTRKSASQHLHAPGETAKKSAAKTTRPKTAAKKKTAAKRSSSRSSTSKQTSKRQR